MTLSIPAPLVFFRVLAERSGKPAALMIDIAGDIGDGDGMLALFDSAPFAALSAGFTCLYPAPAPAGPALAASLQAARWQLAAPGAVCRVDARLDSAALAPAAQWIDGDWCMASPRSSGAQAASRGLALQLVQLMAADADTHEIEALLRRDPTLSYNLLRLVNSPGVGGGRRVTSFSQALLLLGRQQLGRWLNLMLFAAGSGDVRSAMLLARVALRARALELLARARGLDKPTQDQGFMVGMFSLLGALFGMPLPDVLAPLALGEAVQGALLRREGELGALLRVFETAERGALDAVAAQLATLQIGADAFNLAMVDAASWMQGVMAETAGAPHG